MYEVSDWIGTQHTDNPDTWWCRTSSQPLVAAFAPEDGPVSTLFDSTSLTLTYAVIEYVITSSVVLSSRLRCRVPGSAI